MGRAGLNRKTALATATLTLAAEAPDLDVFGRVFGSSAFGFNHHRGFTHSFLGLPLVAAAVVGFMYLIWRLRGRRTRDPNLPPRWGLLFAYAYLAGLSHILLDFTNNYGVRPFWPFSERWYSWDIVFIIEPVLSDRQFLGLIVPGLFSLINEEIGARRKGPKGRLAATVALLGVFAFWGFRDYEHRRAVALLESRTYNNADPLRVSAYPYMFNPFRWYGVAETPSLLRQHERGFADARGRSRRQHAHSLQAGRNAGHARRQEDLSGTSVSDWAQYPVTETEQVRWTTVHTTWCASATCAMPIPRDTRTVLGASGSDKDLQVVAERLG